MKKFLALLLALTLLSTAALAEIDLSGMTYEDLVALKDQINLAIWNSQEWQEVTVPIGVWKIGEDIPEGHWTIRLAPGSQMGWGSIQWGAELDTTGKKTQYVSGGPNYSEMLEETGDLGVSPLTEIDLDLTANSYLVIEYADTIFTPYAGKPSLGFK